jgi:DNA-binding NarL/FixJ family response regulator
MTEDQRLALRRGLFLAAAALQAVCGLVYIFDVSSEITQPSADTWREIFAILALAVGTTITLREYLHILKRNARVERQLGVATGAFQIAIEQHFAQWGLSEAERDVALLSIKGVPISEIARLRGSRDGTVKAQSTAVYRKAGVSSRAELISVLIEDLIDGLQKA